jgi:dTMP kinase
VLLDVPAEVGLARVHGRADEGGPDRLEREALGFHERVRQGFRHLAESDPDRYLVLDATRPIDELAETIRIAARGVVGSRRLPTKASYPLREERVTR